MLSMCYGYWKTHAYENSWFVLIHIPFIYQIKTKTRKKLTINSKDIVFLCLWSCRYEYLRKWQKINEKTTKRAREMEKSQKPRPGKLLVKVELIMLSQSFMTQEMTRMTLIVEVWRNYKNGLPSFMNCQDWSFNDIMEEMTKQVLQVFKVVKRIP